MTKQNKDGGGAVAYTSRAKGWDSPLRAGRLRRCQFSPLSLLPFYVFVFSSWTHTPAVTPIDEAARVAEQLLGPYIGEEHTRQGLVVREPRLNRAFVDPAVRLVERPDPDIGKKNWVRVPEELEAQGLISVVPLRAVGASVTGGSGCAGDDATARTLKKGSCAPGAHPETSSPTSSSSTALPLALGAGAREVVASSFGIASMPLEGGLCGDAIAGVRPGVCGHPGGGAQFCPRHDC